MHRGVCFVLESASGAYFDYETCTTLIVWVEGYGAVHFRHFQRADGKPEAVALCEVADFGERSEQAFADFFRYSWAVVSDDELVHFSSAFLELEEDASAFGGVYGCVGKQVEQHLLERFAAEFYVHLCGVDGE